MTGLKLIEAERLRQIEVEGYTAEHDDQHQDGELALVAALFASPVQLFTVSVDDQRKEERPGYRGLTLDVDDPWPAEWASSSDKRGKVDRINLLSKAGALIAAELDRILRLEGKETDDEHADN